MSHTNYNRISTDNAKDETVTKVAETEIDNANNATPEIESPAEPDIVFGFVDNCSKLNVRKSPSIKSDVLLVLNRDDEVIVRPDDSDDEWYAVYANEQEGFCMKKYITIDI